MTIQDEPKIDSIFIRITLIQLNDKTKSDLKKSWNVTLFTFSQNTGFGADVRT